jgi:hypothetical protein
MGRGRGAQAPFLDPSRRLQEMSGARYTFLHSDAQARHGARGELGLDVFGEYTGTHRPTKTGVISHLEELHTHIPTRLEVVAGRHGSRLAG